jgi:hypothetical protein
LIRSNELCQSWEWEPPSQAIRSALHLILPGGGGCQVGSRTLREKEDLVWRKREKGIRQAGRAKLEVAGFEEIIRKPD